MRSLLMLLLYGVITSARAASPSLADVAADLPPGHWREVPATNRITQVFPPKANHPGWGVVGPKAVIVTWSGGAIADDALYVTGGGHRDYGGNEMYRFRFSDLTWERLTDPSPYKPGCTKTCRTLDGTPTSSHTYDGLAWLPEQRLVWLGSGSAYKSGNGIKQAYVFNPRERRWHPVEAHYSGWLYSDYDPLTRLLLVGSNKGTLSAYDPVTGSYSHTSYPSIPVGDRAGALDQSTRQFVMLAGPRDKQWQLLAYDLSQVVWDNPRSAIAKGRAITSYVLQPDGSRKAGAPHRMIRMGIAYDTRRNRLTAWGGGPSVWTLDTTDWLWREYRTDRPHPSASDKRGRELTRGVYGRWGYLPQYDVFFGFNDPDGRPWIYRPQ